MPARASATPRYKSFMLILVGGTALRSGSSRSGGRPGGLENRIEKKPILPFACVRIRDRLLEELQHFAVCAASTKAASSVQKCVRNLRTALRRSGRHWKATSENTPVSFNRLGSSHSLGGSAQLWFFGRSNSGRRPIPSPWHRSPKAHRSGTGGGQIPNLPVHERVPCCNRLVRRRICPLRRPCRTAFPRQCQAPGARRQSQREK